MTEFMDDEVELFQLSNGRYIMDEEQSKKMFYIKEAAPECSHLMSGTGYSWDESGMGELFAECYQKDTRFCPEANAWFTYKGGRWIRDEKSLVVSERIKEFSRLLAIYCGEISDESRRNEFMKFVVKMGDRRFRDRLMKDAADVLPIHAYMFDSNPYLINCQNGTYDLEKMEFREHRYDDFLTMQTPFSYGLTNARCERWEKFIDEVTCNDKDKAEYLQKALGYSMIGNANEECMFILHGKTTRNGKSTMLSAIHHLLGSYSEVTPVAIICRSDRCKNAEAANPNLAKLKGKRFVTMAESNQYGKLDEEVIKQLTGGEEISARELYQSAFLFLPQFTLWLSCNDLPAVSDKSLFASDRVRVIEFNRHFSNEEQDKNLKTEFQTQEAMAGIFTWLLEGYFKYKRFGLVMPPHMLKVIRQYEKDNDLVLQFLEEKCEKCDEEESTRAKSLYDSFKIWCKSNGYYVPSAKRFNADMEAHPEWHDGKYVKGGYPTFRGIRLKSIV